ncbi:hypothetical protein GCM10011368_02890 [Hyunsoonleella pacifica]|nr:hypothetical protein GCM10011368_02890 [Hyunsoonleella pacifica]
MYLGNGKEGKLVVLSNQKFSNTKLLDTWENTFEEVIIVELDKEEKSLKKAQLHFDTVTAIWLDGDFLSSTIKTEIKFIIGKILKSDGVIGAKGKTAESLATFLQKDGKIVRGLDILPNSMIYTNNSDKEFNEIMHTLPGIVGWNIPDKSAVAIHDGRKVSVVGYEKITLKVAANGDWPAREIFIEQPVALHYDTDLISWNRSALQRTQTIFPPKVAPIPNVESGALLIIGGSGYPKGMWERVIKYSGGTNANYVCISQSKDSYGAKQLKKLGCKNVSVYHTKTGISGINQGEDLVLIEAIKNADAVYFGGGRTYKFMDAYLNTTVNEELDNLLKRGGLILGTSAGAQIQGDFLVRGDPRTNKNIWMEGNDVGLGFLKGVVIDAHFRQRGREKKLPSLLVQHPQMLGIGIDEATAIFVKGTKAEVLGENAVTFYNLKNYNDSGNLAIEKIGNPVILRDGDIYNLELREKIN